LSKFYIYLRKIKAKQCIQSQLFTTKTAYSESPIYFKITPIYCIFKGLKVSLSYQVIELDTVDSTNRYLKEYVSEHQPSQPIFCTTQHQTAGYGQQKRSWLTNEKSAIFSLAYPIQNNSNLPGLVSLHIASLLHQTLCKLTGEVLYVKWPNDLFNDQGKVSGILIEQVLQKEYRSLIIGIGINRDSPDLFKGSSSLPYFSQSTLFSVLFEKVQQSNLLDYSTEELLKYWETHDLFQHEELIHLITETEHIEVTYLGINSDGHAMIKQQNQIRVLASGMHSLRKVNQP